MTELKFTGWNMLNQKKTAEWSDSFSVDIHDPVLTEITCQLSVKSITSIYVFKNGYQPCWETGDFNTRLYIDVNQNDFESVLKRLHSHPILINPKILGLQYSKNGKSLRFWLTGNDIHIQPIYTLIEDFFNQKPLISNLYDPKWMSSRSKLPFTNSTNLPIEKAGYRKMDFKLYVLTIVIPDFNIKRKEQLKIQKYVTMRSRFTIPLVYAGIQSNTNTTKIKLMIDSERRCEFFQNYDQTEFFILMAATWKRLTVAMTELKFTGWTLLKQTRTAEWSDSFSVDIHDPVLTEITCQLSVKSITSIYVFKNGYQPCWETDNFNTRLYIAVKQNNFESVLKHLHSHPILINPKILGLQYRKKLESLRFWLTGNDIHIQPIYTLMEDFFKQKPLISNLYDPKWMCSDTKMPLTESMSLPLEKAGFKQNDPDLYTLTILVTDVELKKRELFKIKNCITMRTRFTIPLVYAAYKTITSFMELQLMIDPRRRCEILQKYDEPEFLILMAATWKRFIARSVEETSIDVEITKNDATKTLVIRL